MDWLRRAVGWQDLRGKARARARARAAALRRHADTPTHPYSRQVVLLTGAAGGIGGALALALAGEHCDLCLSDREDKKLHNLQATCVQFGAGRVVCVAADLHAPEDVEKLARDCLAALGRVDILISNGAQPMRWRLRGSRGSRPRSLARRSTAAVLTSKPFGEQNAEEVDLQLSCNLRAPMLLARLLLPGMLERREGIIINMSSIVSFLTMPNYTVYCASKAGLNAWAVGLRAELFGTGVRVANVCPGFVTGAGMYEDMLTDMRSKSKPLRISALHWLWEVSNTNVARATVLLLKAGAPLALLPLTLAPQRLLGALQSVAPDTVTAAFMRRRIYIPGDPFVLSDAGDPLHKEE